VRVIYSIGAKFAGGGIGNTAYHAVQGLHRHGLLHRLLCGSYKPTEIPRDRIRAVGLPSRALRKLAVYDRTRWITYLHNVLYDRWAAQRMEPCEVFHGWSAFCQRSMARATELGATTIVERPLSHPQYRIPLLREEHAKWGIRYQSPSHAWKRVLKELARADYVLIPSDFVRQSFLKQGFPEKRLVQIPFGVDTQRFRPADERTGHPFRVLFLGQVSYQKGIAYLLAAWKQLGWADAELWIVGRQDRNIGSALSQYRAVQGIRWLGYVTDPVNLLRQADVFAFPSLQEGSALVTYEALASGLPIITTPNAGSVVRHGEDGFIIPIRDSEALAARLVELRGDPSLRKAMGRSARKRAEEYPWGRYQNTLAESMCNLLG